MAKWKWKSKDQQSSGLLYEPGNWGDIVKDEWLLRVLEFTAKHTAKDDFTFYDLFSGQPTYPLSENTYRRINTLEDSVLHSYAKPFLAEEKWPSGAMLSIDVLPKNAKIHVYDLEIERRNKLKAQVDFNILDFKCGWDFFQSDYETDFLFLDPYDFLENWRQNHEKIFSKAKTTSTLIYIYNRSGRKKEYLRDYRAFCAEIENTELKALIGRVRADAFANDCWHEMLFLPSLDLSSSAEFKKFSLELQQATEYINSKITCGEFFETIN